MIVHLVRRTRVLQPQARALALGLREHSSSVAPNTPLASDTFTKKTSNREERMAEVAKLLQTLSAKDKEAVGSMIRVDHSGEIAANTIYEAQADVFGAQGDSSMKKLILEMWDNEKKHLAATSKMLDVYKVRPSALVPLWSLAGRVLGGATALLGPKSAMACTEAVETAIGEHYDDQLAQLEHIRATLLAKGGDMEKIDAAVDLLRRVLIEFRDDELGHLDTAVEHDAQQAPAHALLSAVVAGGCKGAIEIAKRI